MFYIDHQIVIQQWYGHLTQGDHKVSTFMRTRGMIFVYANFHIILETKSHKKDSCGTTLTVMMSLIMETFVFVYEI